jgi:hypothetical protein
MPDPPVPCLRRRLVIAKAQFDAMLQDGSARRSKGSWSSALHVMPKNSNSWRPCDDYRALNVWNIPNH